MNALNNIRFTCPRCFIELVISVDKCGEKARCAYCNNITIVPYPQDSNAVKQCPACKEVILKDAKKCKHCGESLSFYTIKESPLLNFFTRFFSRRHIGTEELVRIPLTKIEANPFQPREVIPHGSLQDLKNSISQYGIIVPIIVTKNNGSYQLVAGQRRFVAARELGMKYIPAIVRKLSIKEMMEVGYLENLHREDLNILDKVQCFERIANEYPEIGRENLAAMMGININDLDRMKDILKLPMLLQEAIRAEMLTEKHAGVLKEIPNRKLLLKAVEEVYKKRLSLADTEEYVNYLLRKNPRYISSQQSSHVHLPTCEYVKHIPDVERVLYYSRREAQTFGKLLCLQCF